MNTVLNSEAFLSKEEANRSLQWSVTGEHNFVNQAASEGVGSGKACG